jgi:hypothetical protein
MTFMIVMPAAAWAAQFKAALAAITARNGGRAPATLAECDGIDHAQFARMIQALAALASCTGQAPGPELIRMAGLRPLGEFL